MSRDDLWFQSFLGHRELTHPDGRMLFSYRTTTDEYAALRGLLANTLAALQGAPWIPSRSSSECACFVLYAAEWWRREYAGGAWRWTTILDSIGPKYRLDVLARTTTVEAGLKAWGHCPSGQGKKYLGAIVAQGGLPLRLVAQGNGAIAKLLIRGTRQAQIYGWDNQRLESFFQEHDEELVQHLRDEDIHRLLASVVTTALNLRRDHKLAGASNPVEVLERQQPDWRNQFPIAVEEDRAEALLVGLVHEAAREVVRGAVYPVTAARRLQRTCDESTFRLVTSIAMPTSVSLEALAKACDLAADKIPPAFSLDLVGTERVPLAEARQLLGSGEQMIVLSGRSRVLNDVHELRFVVRSKGVDWHMPVAIPGGDELDESQPWVFVERDDVWVLAGMGGCRVAEDKCLVALPSEAQLRTLGADATITHRCELHAADMQRVLYEVTGQVEVEVDAVAFTIRTRQTADLSEQLIWHGQRERYQSDPFPIYRGVPKLYRVGLDGERIQVHERQLIWTTATRPPQRVEQPSMHVGPIDAWLMADGVRSRRFRMVLLSKQAELKFRSGSDDKSGSVEFLDWGFANVDMPSTVSPYITRDGRNAMVNLAVDATPPVSVKFQVTWSCSPHALRLTLPFPAIGVRFILPTGEEIGQGCTVSVARMASIRIQVLGRNPDRPLKYKLVAELKSGVALRSQWSCVEQPIQIGPDGSGELRLLDIEASLLGLLCQSDSLDAKLLLRVYAGVTKLAELSVARYDAELERQGQMAALTTAQLQGVKLCAIPLLQAEFVEQELKQADCAAVPAGRCWDLSALTMAGSPWLVVSASDSSLLVRPMLYQVCEAEGPVVSSSQLTKLAQLYKVRGIDESVADRAALCQLAEAMSIAEAESRSTALDVAVAAMAKDYDHPSWRLVSRQYMALSHLPLNTLDYWRAFARSPAGSVAVLLKLSHDMPQLARRMREELGVVWELTSGAALKDALKCLRKSWIRQLGPEQESIATMLTQETFKQLATSETSLADGVALAFFQTGMGRTEHFDQLLGEIRVGAPSLAQNLWQGQESLLQRYLLRTHVDDEFWPGFKLTDALAKRFGQTPSWLELEKRFGPDVKKLFWLPTRGQPGPYKKNVKEDVANVPMLCGLWSQSTGDVLPWWTPGEIDQIRQLRAFAPEWFERASESGRRMILSIQMFPPTPFRRST